MKPAEQKPKVNSDRTGDRPGHKTTFEEERPRLLGYDEASKICRDGGIRCGCRKGHKMLPFSDRIASYNDKYWVYECLLEKLVADQARLKKTLSGMHRQITKMKAVLASTPCFICQRPVGKSDLDIGSPRCIECKYDRGCGD